MKTTNIKAESKKMAIELATYKFGGGWKYSCCILKPRHNRIGVYRFEREK